MRHPDLPAGLDILTRPGVDPETAPGRPALPPADHALIDTHGLALERNASIRLRDGVTIYADIYRPAFDAVDLPVLLAWGPYGKHNQKANLWPEAGIADGWMSPLTGFESPDPVRWCAEGYAAVYVDPRGLWRSEGVYPHNGPQEGDDLVDTIAWLAEQPWSNGRVGMLGVSYLAGSQYLAASLRPPALRAISPWECFSDWYREFAFHGGIPETGFIPRASTNCQWSQTETENTYANVLAHRFDDDYYASKRVDLEAIEVPAYVVASWSDHGLHTRGTLEAYRRMSSRDKWLEVHGEKKWAYFYAPDSVARQVEFFDHYLKTEPGTALDRPRVRLQVRDRPGVSTWRTDLDWPIDETDAVTLHVHPDARSLGTAPVAQAVAADVDPAGDWFEAAYAFTDTTDLVGPARLKLWLEIDAGDDADVFVALRKVTADGVDVRFPFNALADNGPIALGWLRASHRAVDANASTPLRPYHPHEGEAPLEPGVPVLLDIEIWPSATRFHAGDRLVLTVTGRDVAPQSDPTVPRYLHEDLRNAGTWRIHAGGGRESTLLVPLRRPR